MNSEKNDYNEDNLNTKEEFLENEYEYEDDYDDFDNKPRNKYLIISIVLIFPMILSIICGSFSFCMTFIVMGIIFSIKSYKYDKKMKRKKLLSIICLLSFCIIPILIIFLLLDFVIKLFNPFKTPSYVAINPKSKNEAYEYVKRKLNSKYDNKFNIKYKKKNKLFCYPSFSGLSSGDNSQNIENGYRYYFDVVDENGIKFNAIYDDAYYCDLGKKTGENYSDSYKNYTCGLNAINKFIYNFFSKDDIYGIYDEGIELSVSNDKYVAKFSVYLNTNISITDKDINKMNRYLKLEKFRSKLNKKDCYLDGSYEINIYYGKENEYGDQKNIEIHNGKII